MNSTFILLVTFALFGLILTESSESSMLEERDVVKKDISGYKRYYNIPFKWGKRSMPDQIDDDSCLQKLVTLMSKLNMRVDGRFIQKFYIDCLDELIENDDQTFKKDVVSEIKRANVPFRWGK
jgi:hypothetical protein